MHLIQRLCHRRGSSAATRPLCQSSNALQACKASKHEQTTSANLNHVSFYSWNVNGVGPLLHKELSFDTKVSFHVSTRSQSHDSAMQRRLQLVANAGH